VVANCSTVSAFVSSSRAIESFFSALSSAAIAAAFRFASTCVQETTLLTRAALDPCWQQLANTQPKKKSSNFPSPPEIALSHAEIKQTSQAHWQASTLTYA
jgi:hypothetical protein